MTYQKAASIKPPLHPWFPYFPPAQSTKSYSENNLVSLVLLTLINDSRAPVVENVQHDPQAPQSLTQETTPFVLQSTKSATPSVPMMLLVLVGAETLANKYVFLNSSDVKSMNQFCPKVNLDYSALTDQMVLQLSLKTVNLYQFISGPSYFLLQVTCHCQKAVMTAGSYELRVGFFSALSAVTNK